jgi:hypothetical protein
MTFSFAVELDEDRESQLSSSKERNTWSFLFIIGPDLTMHHCMHQNELCPKLFPNCRHDNPDSLQLLRFALLLSGFH